MSGSADYLAVKACGGFQPISDRVHLVVTGPDAARYLNGQITNHLPSGTESRIYACITNAKGKLQADLFLARFGDGFHLDAEPALAEVLGPRLEQFLIADNVEIEDRSEAFALVHVLAPARPNDLAGITPLAIHACDRLGQPGMDVLVQRESLETLDPGDLPGIDADLADVLRIENGIPRWGFELDGSVLPPEAGLDTRAIDYFKGCYVGQEVISRIRSVGRVNRSLRHLLCPVPLPAGSLLRDMESGAEAGVLTSVTDRFGLDKPIALGYVRRSWTETGTRLLAVSPSGEPLSPEPVEVRPLPGPAPSD